jgi:hypothetical protein
VALLALAGIWTTTVGATPERGLKLRGPKVVATGVSIKLAGSDSLPGAYIDVERRRSGRWQRIKSTTAGEDGRFTVNYKPLNLSRRYVFRARAADGSLSAELDVLSRDVTLMAVGDVNLGDGPATAMAVRGRKWPWRSVAPLLRKADIAAANLECAVSKRGAAVPKEFNFRGTPGALRVARRFAGLDVVSLANNHAGDYGAPAMLDTARYARRFSIVPVGAGVDRSVAYRPRVVEVLGLRVAFLAFSDIGPVSFFAAREKPGTAAASVPAVRSAVKRAARSADLVVTTFHWGIERATQENGRQRALAVAALSAGAKVVIGGHPHVLQPIRRVGKRRVVAYSLGNFIFSAGSPGTARTGVLKLRLSQRGVEGVRFLPAAIVNSQPRLIGRAL